MSVDSGKKYQVFISSTFKDLEQERLSIMKAIMGIDCIPAGMEDFPAFDETQLTYIKKIIDQCDYYVLLLGGRYGSTDSEGISFTQREYEYAVTTGCPILAFVHEDTGDLLSKNTETDPKKKQKLEAFRNTVMDGRIVKLWRTADQLPGLALVALNQAIRLKPRIGWVRGDQEEIQKIVAELRERRDKNLLLESEIERLKLEMKKMSDEFELSTDDPYELYSRAAQIANAALKDEKLNGETVSQAAERETAKRSLEKIREMALNHRVGSNILFNSGVTAAKLKLEELALEFSTLACFLDSSDSHRISLAYRETVSAIRYIVSDTEDRIVLLRDRASPESIRADALRTALLLISDAPVPQCEITYGQAWNILQQHRETIALELACNLLKASYFARSGRFDEIEKLPLSQTSLLPDKINWLGQKGKTAPSYMLEKIAELIKFMCGPNWLEETKLWFSLAERKHASEAPSVTWYEPTSNGLREIMKEVQIVEARMKQDIKL